jgi:iron complex outermembrane receptor protein
MKSRNKTKMAMAVELALALASSAVLGAPAYAAGFAAGQADLGNASQDTQGQTAAGTPVGAVKRDDKRDAKRDDNEVKEVVVTARRRTERLKDVPLTVSVIDGEALDQKNISTLRDVVEHSPQVSYQQTGDVRTDTLSIRGISSVSNVAGVEPDAAIVIDGETLARTMEMNYDTVDIQRIEILEGPQGTLFGKNAVAGMLNVITRGPTLSDHSTYDLKFDAAQDDEFRVKGSANIPLSKRSALYLNAFKEYQGGWVQNVHPGQPNGGQEQGSGGRIQYLIKPDDTLSILVRAEASHKTMGIIPYAFKSLTQDDVVNASKALSGGTAMVPQFNGLLSNSGINLVSSTGVPTPLVNSTQSYLYNDRQWGEINSHAFSASVKKSLEDADLIYLGSYRYFNLNSNDNAWGVSAPQLSNSEFGLNRIDYAGPSRERTIQQEIRLESKKGQDLNYVVGAFYYFNDNFHHETFKTCNDAVYGYYNGAGYPSPNPVNKVDGFNCTGGYQGNYSTNDFVTTVKTHNEAFFGDIDYHVWAGLNVFGGARQLWEQQKMSLQHLAGDNTAPYFFDKADPYGELKGSDSRHAFIHRIGAKYDFGPVMAYFNESTGFKGAAWDNYNLVSRAVAAKPLAPERPRQYEFGLRGDHFNHKLDWQYSAYQITDNDFQARVIWFQPGAISNRVVDAGTVRSRGQQIGFNWRALPNLKVGGGYALLDAKFINSVLIPQRGGTNANLNGYTLPNAPRRSYSAYADYRLPDLTEGVSSNLRLEVRGRSEQRSTVVPDVLQNVDAYHIFDAYYRAEAKDGRWGLTAYVKNLGNHLYYERPFEPAVLGWTTGQMAALPRDYKRYVGFNINYHWE